MRHFLRTTISLVLVAFVGDTFIAPLIAVVATGIVARLVYHLSMVGLVICLGLCFGTRIYFKRRADNHERQYRSADTSGDEAV